MSEGTRWQTEYRWRAPSCKRRRHGYVEKLLWGGNSLGISNCRPSVQIARLRSEAPGRFKFSPTDYDSGIVAVVIVAIHRGQVSPRLACCWWFALQKSELPNRAASKGVEAGSNHPLSPSEIRESFLLPPPPPLLEFSHLHDSYVSKYRHVVYRLLLVCPQSENLKFWTCVNQISLRVRIW